MTIYRDGCTADEVALTVQALEWAAADRRMAYERGRLSALEDAEHLEAIARKWAAEARKRKAEEVLDKF